LVEAVGRAGVLGQTIGNPLNHLADLTQRQHDLIRSGSLLLGGERDLASRTRRVGESAPQLGDGVLCISTPFEYLIGGFTALLGRDDNSSDRAREFVQVPFDRINGFA
jgi:hypothetical protein